jgi:hypothetical protein
VQDPGCGGGEIVDNDGPVELIGGGLFELGTVAGADEERGGEFGVPSGLQIDEFVAHQVAGVQVEVKFVASIEEKTG